MSLALSFCLLAGCGTSSKTKQEIVQKTDSVKTTGELKNALGNPDGYDMAEVPVLGKVETFVYKGSDGDMTFVAHNGKIVTRASGDGRRKKESN